MRERDFGEIVHKDGISPAWPLPVRGVRALLCRGRAAVPRSRAARRGSDRAARRADRFPHPPVSHEPRIQALSDELVRKEICTRFICRSESCSTRRTARRRRPASASAATPSTAFPVCSTARPTRRSSASIRRCEAHPNLTLLTGAYVSKLETDAGGPQRSTACACTETASRSATRPTSWSSPAARCRRRCCCCARRATPIRTGLPTAPVRSGATTCVTTSRS